MSSSNVSETSTVLPSPDGMDTSRNTLHDYNRDVPVSLSAFSRNVTRCKAFLGPSLAINLALEIAQQVIKPKAKPLWGPYETMTFKLDNVFNIIGIAATGLMLITYVASLIWPVKTPKHPYDPLRNSTLHRFTCITVFLLSAIMVILHVFPAILYVCLAQMYPPRFIPVIFPEVPELSLSRLRYIFLVISLAIVGGMRRGPKMQYTPLKLGTGFGVNAEKDDAKAMDKAVVYAEDIEMLKNVDVKEEECNVLDYSNSSMLDFIFLTYVTPLARTSIMKPRLLLSDLPHIEEFIRRSGEGQVVSNKSGRIRLHDQKDKVTRWILVKAVWGDKLGRIMVTLIFESLTQLMGFVQAISMYEIIRSLDDPDRIGNSYPYLMCWGLFLGQVLECFLQAYTWTRENYLLHMPVRFALSSILFTKILRCSDAKSKEAHNLKGGEAADPRKGKSQVVNLLTIDTGQICGMATRVWAISNALISLFLGSYILYGMFGVSAFIGISVVPLTGPISFWISRSCYRADKAWAQARDARTSAVKEFLLGYKVIKLNGFEPYFKHRIERLREHETIWQRWRFWLGTFYNITADQLPSLAIAITFLTYTKVFHHSLDPATAFVAINIFNRVKTALQAVPNIIQGFFDMLVAIDRICKFLNHPDVEPLHDDETSDSLVFSNATITWPTSFDQDDNQDHLFRLTDVDLRLPRGKFTLVCGPLGSGKTLLLRSLLGESVVEKGYITAPSSAPDATPLDGMSMGKKWTLDSWLDDSVAYAPQQAYIRHGTIRDNILFGQPMWPARYKEALRQASLLSDLKLLNDGDHTEVGEHGVTLSGGQRARVNLARCIYSRAKTVYMDDILSAVDAHTAQYIYEECLTGTLLKGRTVILVTHHVALCLPGADYLVTLNNGLVEQACPAYDAKVENLEELEKEQHIEEPPMDAKHVEEPVPGDDEEMAAPSRQIYRTEHASEGRVATNHYKLVFNAAGGKLYWLGIALLYGGTQTFDLIKPIFMRGWSSDPDPAHLDHYLKGWFSLVAATVLLGAFRWVWLYGVRKVGFYNRGSIVLHDVLLTRVCEAPMSFFEATPMGRIINIFSQDMFRLDASVADAFGRTLAGALGVGSAAVVTCVEAPPLIAILALFAIPVNWLTNRLGKLRADLRRLTAIADSPLISLYSDASQGIVMIRAFGSNEFMLASVQALFNRSRQAYCADWQVFNWVRSTIRAVASVFCGAAGFLMVRKGLSGSEVGLVLTFAVSASQGLFMLMQQFSELEQTFVSAERINYYVSMDEKESDEGEKPALNWPAKGAVEFKEMSVRYADDLPEVLHKISFKVEPGMRVGLVGSTGSGKSTLALTLFRAIDPHEGSIEVDGTDIMKLEMHELRRRLNMVVQDASLCSGTLRDALDITGDKDDAEIYEALKRVHLLGDEITEAEVEKNPFANLETFVAVEGANFSQGERQLLCLARALLKKSKVLVMDEATSSVDFDMDAKITATIKEAFAGTTMLVIAHRLATIMQYDRVLVLDKGRILEYASPLSLIENSDSAFHGLCMAQGQEEFDKLLAIARDN